MNAHFLILEKRKEPKLVKGIMVEPFGDNAGIRLAKIDGAPARKTHAMIDRKRPAEIKNGKIFEVYFQLYGSKQFSDEKSFVTVCKPKQNTGKAAILTSTRWPNLDLEIIAGRPNGFVPGVQILDKTDTIAFKWEGVRYTIYNMGGDVYLSSTSQNKVPGLTQTSDAMAEAMKLAGLSK